MRTLVPMVVACAVLVAAAERAVGQVVRPDAAERLVGRFDFERDESHLEPVPRHWVRVVDTPERALPGYPAWNESGFDDAVAFRGDSSVVLPTRGGSAALRLSGGVLAVMPGADYVVTAQVRTRGLTHARARMTARLLDESLEPIPGAAVSTAALRSPDAWREVRVELKGDRPEAAWIQIDLELLQPAQRADAAPAEHELRLEDFSGAAWFDEVEVRQLPRVTLATNSPINFILAPQTPTLTARVLDLTGERLGGVMVVRDIDGNIVDAHQFDASSRGAGVSWTPRVPRFGWYEAALVIESGGERVARTDLSFVFAPARPVPADRARFGLIATRASDEQLDRLRALIEVIGAGRVQLPLWSGAIGAEAFERRLQAMEPLLGVLLDRGLRVTLTLDDAVTSAEGESVTALELAESAPIRLSDLLDPALVRFGQRIHRWHAGVAGAWGMSEQERLPERVDALAHVLSRLSPEPIVGLPWPGAREVDPEVASRASLTLTVPSAAPPDAVDDYFAMWREAGVGASVAALERAPERISTPRSRVIDMAKRAVFASVEGAPPISIVDPWKWNGPAPSPAPEAAAWRTLADRLAGRTVIGELPAPDGSTALILSGAGAPETAGSALVPTGAIVAWRDWAAPEDAALEGYLGAERLVVSDLFGNERLVTAGEDGAHRIPLTAMPIFIEGVDERIASFRGSFRIEPPFVESIAARHEMELVIPNPWPAPISGRLRVVEPAHWDVAPRVQRFSAQPGEEVRLPVIATLGVGEESGVHQVRVEMDLLADGEHPLFTVDAPVQVGLADMTMTATARITDAGDDADIVITVLVTNTSDRRVTMVAFSTAPGFARQEAPISGLEPGASTVRQFSLPGGAGLLRGRSVRVGLQDVDGPLRLNKTLEIR